jgi:hypothetical protein
LDLSNNHIDPKGLIAVVNALKENQSVTSFNIANNGEGYTELNRNRMMSSVMS